MLSSCEGLIDRGKDRDRDRERENLHARSRSVHTPNHLMSLPLFTQKTDRQTHPRQSLQNRPRTLVVIHGAFVNSCGPEQKEARVSKYRTEEKERERKLCKLANKRNSVLRPWLRFVSMDFPPPPPPPPQKIDKFKASLSTEMYCTVLTALLLRNLH